ncbi:MAG: hypothetical protein KBS74_01700 [Clostridiales bacterium]|nr:hypothetical protein [Candidatus Cacconaster stercorequi]
MATGQYIIGGLIGLVFGTGVACLSAWLSARSLETSKTTLVLGVSFLRQLFDIAALLIVYLLRNVLPFPLYALLIGTALGLSIGGIVLAARIGKKMDKKQKN